MKKILGIALSASLFTASAIFHQASAQGCVAIRSTGGLCTMEHAAQTHQLSKWTLGANHRYFKSFRHFVGTEEQKHRMEEKSEVINRTHSLDLLVTRHLNDRWSFTLDVPIISNFRSSLYEHDRVNRHNTRSFGIGDVRLSAYRWMLDPAKAKKANVQLGLGIKLPTGDYKYQDFFYKNDTTLVLGPVDQSIQLGDGGTGFTAELNSYYNLSKTVSIYGNFFYLLNPREQNGVSTARGGAPTQQQILFGRSTMSVPDQYMARVGGNLTLEKFTLSAGGRFECLPAKDLVGGSKGFRRPGYILSAEPGITYTAKKLTLYSYVPVALVRNRTQSVPDKLQTAATKVYTKGDAAFADYAINVGFSVRL